jgi:penicillin-binding protein 1A
MTSVSPQKKSLRRWLVRLAWGFALCLVFVALGLAGTYLYFDRGLPSVDALRTYRPPQVTKVYCQDGSLCAEFYKERRTWVDIQTLPKHVKDAFLAAEDADFYQHEGLDFLGILRAGLKSLLPGRQVTGASTITQQTCRNLLLSQERKLSRKIREWILTPRMEKALTKDEILNLYVNQINFGHGRYGIEEAALFYFGKPAKELSLGEAASLAGTVQLPERINPLTNMVKAKRRQRYVLDQMARHDFLSRQAAEAEMEKPLALSPRPKEAPGAYYAEEIRRALISRYGEETLYSGGMRVEIAMQPRLQAAAEAALRNGLEALDRRMGYSGPQGNIPNDRFEKLKPLLQKRLEEAGRRKRDEALVIDLAGLLLPPPSPPKEEELSAPEAEELESPDEALVNRLPIRSLEPELRLTGRVALVDDGGKRATLDLIGRRAEMSFASVGWARQRGVGKWTAPPSKMSDVVKVGDLVRLKVTKVGPDARCEVTLDQLPEVQGALVAIEPKTRAVVAMVGGYDFAMSAFNRATQAKRQPGSAFKPFLYAAALASHQYTPLSVVNDAPEPIRDPYTGKVWAPQNYERTGFEGPMTLRQALTKSKNTVSVRLIESLGPAAAIDLARRTGIHSAMPDNLTLALGTGEVSVLELANAYATLQSEGKFSPPITLERVVDGRGVALEEYQPQFEERLAPEIAFLTTSLMRSVVEEGTAVAVRDLGRPAAGKTGTASEYRDAWFSGYTTDFVATVWVGFDNHESLGNGETGARAALPIWLDFMKAAHQDLSASDFSPPPGVTFARVDPSTGLLAGSSVPGRLEPFLQGTAPTALSPSPGQADPSRFFLDDGSRGTR